MAVEINLPEECTIANKSSIERPFSDFAITFSATTILIMAVFGIIANTITIITILLSPKMRSIFYSLILSLCVSDLLSALISPLFLYRRTWGYDNWKLGPIVCKGIWALDYWTSFVTSTHIGVFALLRYISVRSFSNYNKVKNLQPKVPILCGWILTFICGAIPMYMLTSSIQNIKKCESYTGWPKCTIDHKKLDALKLYIAISYSLFYYFVILSIVIFSLGIGYTLKQRRFSRTKPKDNSQDLTTIRMNGKKTNKENRIVVQLFLIIGSFLLGYIPRTTYHFVTVHSKPNTQYDIEFDWTFGMISYICLRLSECLNPIFYNLASRKMRSETKRILKKLC